MGTLKEKVLKLMSDGKWHSTIEIVTNGGSEGMRRLRELRASILAGKLDYRAIERRRDTENKNQYTYRLIKKEKVPVAKKVVKPKPSEPMKDALDSLAAKKATKPLSSDLPKKVSEVAEPALKLVKRTLSNGMTVSRMVPVRSLETSRVGLEGEEKKTA